MNSLYFLLKKYSYMTFFLRINKYNNDYIKLM